MKNRLFAALIFMFVLCVPAFALSDAEYKKMMKDPEFSAADKKLNRAYSDAKKKVRKEGLKHLQERQRDWIKYERDSKAEELIDNGYSKLEAYTQVTLERADALKYETDLINSEGNFYSKKGVHLEITWQNPLTGRLYATLEYRGDEWTGEGPYDNEYNDVQGTGASVTLIEVDDDTIEIRTNDEFKDRINFDAEGIYKRRSK